MRSCRGTSIAKKRSEFLGQIGSEVCTFEEAHILSEVFLNVFAAVNQHGPNGLPQVCVCSSTSTYEVYYLNFVVFVNTITKRTPY